MKHLFSLCAVVAQAVLLFFSPALFAASADPDATFNGGGGGNGLVIHNQDPFGNLRILSLNSITVQPDGKIVVVGEKSTSNASDYHSFVARLLTDGSRDNSFDGDGWLELDVPDLRDSAFEVLVQADGKIVVGGQLVSNDNAPNNGNFYAARLNSDGTLDSSFGVQGVRVVNYPNAEEGLLGMALRSDGGVVLAGQTNTNGSVSSFFAQLTSNGELDTSFGGGDGMIAHPLATDDDYASGIDLDGNGRIIFTGGNNNGTSSNTLVGRLNADGSLDTTFASGIGYRVITDLNSNLRDFGDEILALPDGSLLLALTIDTATSGIASMGVLKLNGNGDRVSGFGSNGLRQIAPDSAQDISIINVAEISRQADGKLVLVGAEARLQGNGFIAETARLLAVRLNADGSFDDSFDDGDTVEDGIVRQNFGITAVNPRAAALQGDGKLLTAGRARVPVGGPNNYTSYAVTRMSADPVSVDVEPDAFTLGSTTGAQPNSLQQSQVITVSGLDSGIQVPVLIANGEYSIDAGSFTSQPGWASNGAQISVRHTASGLGNTTVTSRLTVGGIASQFNGSIVLGTSVSADFTSTTSNVDTDPDSFAFTAQTEVALDSWIVSNTITVTGIDFATPISISNGEYSIGCTGTFTSTAASVTNGQTVCVRQRSAATVSTSKTSTLTIGTDSAGFVTTTAATVDTVPDAFSFTAQTGLGLNATVTSNTVTITGLTAPAAISVSGSGGYSIGCTSTFINTASTISNGEAVCLRHVAANANNATVTTTLTIGGVAASFTSTTVASGGSGGGGRSGGGGGGSVPALMLLTLAMLAYQRRKALRAR